MSWSTCKDRVADKAENEVASKFVSNQISVEAFA